jgi:hypothetical protein
MKKLEYFLGGWALLACASLAHADLQLSTNLGGICYGPTGGATPDLSGSCYAVPTVVGSGVKIFNFSGYGQQTPAPTQTFSSTTNIQNTSGSTVTLDLFIVDQYFTTPTTPPAINWMSNLQITSITGTGSVSMTSCIDTGNTLTPCPGGSLMLANNSLSYSGTSTPPQDTVTRTVASLTGTYSLSEEVIATLGAGSSINIIASQVLTSVPEPASVLLLGSALLGLTALVRKKTATRS